MTTAQKPRQEQFSAPYCSGDRGAFAGCVVCNQMLVPLELAPGDVTFVLILEQHLPLRLRAPQTALDTLAAVLDAHLAHRAAKGIGAGADGVGQNVTDGSGSPDCAGADRPSTGGCRQRRRDPDGQL